MREGDLKYLKLGGKEWLFDVVEDQHERANLKDKRPDVFNRLKADWAAWNAAMLRSADLQKAMAAHMSKQQPEFAD